MKYRLKKVFKSKGSLSSLFQEIEEADLTDPAILDVIMQSQEFAEAFPDAKKTYVNQQNAAAIDAVLNEFFDAFFLIGLDPKGDGHFIQNQKTFQQKAIMRHLLENYLTSDDDDFTTPFE